MPKGWEKSVRHRALKFGADRRRFAKRLSHGAEHRQSRPRHKGDGAFDALYLADADFVVAPESEKRETLDAAQSVLTEPKWQLFLGRKSFASAASVYFREGVITIEKSLADFLRSRELKEVLDEYDDEFGRKAFGFQREIHLIVESEAGGETRQGVPLSFAARRFTNRRVKTEFIDFSKGGEKDHENLSDEIDA